MKTTAMISMLFLVLGISDVFGQVPQTMNYQGILTDAGGNLMPDGNYTLTFKLYDSITGGTLLWTELHNVPVSKGVFNVILGKTTPLNLAFDKPYFLGTTVGSGGEMTPRIQLTSVAYSLNAEKVKGSTNIFPSSGNVGVGTTSPQNMLEVKNNIAITGSGTEGGQLSLIDGDGTGGWEIDNFGSTGTEALRLFRGRGSNDIYNVLNVNTNGKIGIGTAAPAERLEVNGFVKSDSGYKFPDGTVQKTAASSSSGGGDNLGNHTATQNISLNGHWLSPDGSDIGMFINNSGGVLFEGSTISSTIPKEGAGTRLMWYPKKSAIRIGHVDAIQWNDANIGLYSVALGYNTKADGMESTAMGYNTVAGGIGSTALGYQTIASGTSSSSLGEQTIAHGIRSTSIGYYSNATGDISTALGDSTTASGYGSLATGFRTSAKGLFSSAMGGNSIASGNYSVAMGQYTKVYGDYSGAIGLNNEASGYYSFAAGQNTIASASHTVAIGNNCHASGSSSTALGDNTVAEGNYSTALGVNTKATGDYSTAMGYDTWADGDYSSSLGCLASAPYEGSFIIGDHSGYSCSTNRANQMVMRFFGGYDLLTSSTSWVELLPGDNSWRFTSDSTKKYSFLPVDGESILNKIRNFDLRTWSYKGQNLKQFRHYGPMAQEFFNAFGHDAYGVIGNDTTINSADFDGINLTAIQALIRRTDQLRAATAKISGLEEVEKTLMKEVQDQKAEIEAQNEMMTAIRGQLAKLGETVEVLTKERLSDGTTVLTSNNGGTEVHR